MEHYNVTSYGENGMSTAGWSLIVVPTGLTALVLVLSVHLRFWLLAAAFAFAAIALCILLITLVAIQLETCRRVTVSTTGIVERRFSITGLKTRRIYHEDIRELRASLQGTELVRLTAYSHNNAEITLLTCIVENFTDQAQFIARLLDKPYVLSVGCPRSPQQRERNDLDSPDFVKIDTWNRKITLEYLDRPATELIFQAVLSVTVVGQANPISYDIGTKTEHYEYVYQPTIHFVDGTSQLLQRFCSIEAGKTEQSEALLSATRFARYIFSCISGEAGEAEYNNSAAATGELMDVK